MKPISIKIAIAKNMNEIRSDLNFRLQKAISHFWKIRFQQEEKQKKSGKSDQGARSAVTGGAHMNGMVQLLSEIIQELGMTSEQIFIKKALELPGFFRPTKEWDLLAVRDGQLILAVEVKSQVGPSFGNNFNNRTEEAMGSAVDLWTAYREGALNRSARPWLGYIFVLEDCDKSQAPIRVKEPHFTVLAEFKNASYAKRYELFCRKLVRERHYDSSAFLLSKRSDAIRGDYREPAEDLRFVDFIKSLVAHVSAFGI